MPICEATAKELTASPTTSFTVLGLKERSDLQRLLAARIDALKDGLLVLAEEFAGRADSARRSDLLCLDRESRLVVSELKRDEDGGHMELHALPYAAMVPAMTFNQAASPLPATASRMARRFRRGDTLTWEEPAAIGGWRICHRLRAATATGTLIGPASRAGGSWR